VNESCFADCKTGDQCEARFRQIHADMEYRRRTDQWIEYWITEIMLKRKMPRNFATEEFLKYGPEAAKCL